jgi:AcrR family transcriptional regulator
VTDHRSRPRRRGEELRTAIFDAVLAELDEHGYAGVNMEAIAERARVSKASLYRRWTGKMDLVVDAVSTAFPEPDSLEDTGSLRGDLLANLRDVARLLAGPTGQALRALFGDALSDPERAREVRSRAQGRSARSMRALVERAIARGELPVMTLTPRQEVAGHAMLRHHFLWQGEVPDELIVQIVDEILLPLVLSASGRPAPSGEAPS